jgi:hypothetical protein
MLQRSEVFEKSTFAVRGRFPHSFASRACEDCSTLFWCGWDMNKDIESTSTPLASTMRHNHQTLFEVDSWLRINQKIGICGHWSVTIGVTVLYKQDFKRRYILLLFTVTQSKCRWCSNLGSTSTKYHSFLSFPLSLWVYVCSVGSWLVV